MHVTILCPPGQGGVRDFAEKLLENLEDSAKQVILSENSRVEFEASLMSDCLYVQYSGYGYAKRGAPLWLLDELKRNRYKIKKLGIFFHELYASGSLWSSAFWLSPAQRHIARRLAELSDFWITNREHSAEWLCRFAADKPHEVLPVFSNVGEMPIYSQVRAPKVVVFGGSGLRLSTYRTTGDALFFWAKRQGLEIHDIGPTISDPIIVKSLSNEGVKVHGRLEQDEISRLLADAMFGVVVYPIEYVAKSGVFAAYCAHGICPVLISDSYHAADGLVPSQHYLPGLTKTDYLFANFNQIAQAAWNWYQLHRLSIHVLSLQNLMAETSNA